MKIRHLCLLLLLLFSKINLFSQTSTPGAGMTDIDGNVYPTIILGTQEWCKENLKTTKFRNGDLIPYISSNVTWANSTTPAKCIYNNDSLQHYNVFGYLYNFYAVEDPRNLCPSGWHVPSDYEWTVLTNHLGGLPVAGGKMKSLNIWNAPNTGATNITGFTALPGGLRDYPGNFSSIFATGNWWSSTPKQMVGYIDGYYRAIWFNGTQVDHMSYSKKDGFSVRCIRDSICSIDTSVYLNIPPTINACGDSTLINAGSGYTSYTWNTGSITSSIYAKATGWYKVTVSNGTCTATDSVYVSLVKAKITASKTRICKGETITLIADSSADVNYNRNYCSTSDIPTQLRSGLIAYYPFCGNVNDISGNGNNGNNNGVTFASNRFGNINTAASFNGGSRIDLPLNLNGALVNITKFTLSAFVNLPVGPNNGQSIFSNWKAFPLTDPFGVNIGAGGKFLGFSNNAGTGVGTKNTITTSQWVHVCTVFDGSKSSIYDRVNLYINGVKQAMDTGGYVYTNSVISNNLGNTATNTAIGAWMSQFGWIGYYNGLLDDIGIWNRVLTENEIQALSKTSGFTYNWTNNKTGNNNGTSSAISVTPTTTTKYYLTVNNGTSTCIDSVTIVVDELPNTAIPKNIKHCGDSIRIIPDTNFVSYVWNTDKSSKTIYADTSGWYKLTVTDANGCVNKDSSLVSIVKSKIIAPITNTCYGSPLFLYADTLAKKSKLYPSNISWLPNNETTSKITMNGLSGAFYKLIVSNTVHSCRDSVLITVNALPIPSVPKNIKYCGDSIRIIPDTNFVSYLWNTGRSGKTIYADTSGWYKLTVTDVNGCINKDSALVSVVKSKIIAPITNTCYGSPLFLYADTLAKKSKLYPSNISWLPNNETTSKITMNGLSGAFYKLIVSNTVHSCIDSVLITVNALPIPSVPKNIKYCGDSIRIIPDTNFVSYVWNTGKSSKTIYADTSGWYKLTVTDVNGCINKDSALVSVVKSKIIAPITNTCYGSPLFLYADTLAKKSKLYPSNISWLPNNENTSKIKLTGVIGGYNKLQVSDGIQTCRDSVLITVNALPIPSVPKNIKHCGDSIRIIPDTNFVSYVWNTGKSSKTIYADTSGWYKLTVTDVNGCINKDSSLVSVIKAEIKSDTITFCKGNHVNLKAIYKNLQSIVYPDQLLWSTTEQTPVIQVSPLTNSTYNLTVSNAIGGICSAQVALTVNNITADLFGKDTLYVCNDSAIVTALNGLHNFVWKPLTSNTQQVVVKQNGWVYLTAQNANNCLSSDSIYVYFTNTDFQLSDTVVCSGAGIITANPIEKGGTFIGTHVVNNQFTIPSKGGLYNITYSINNGTCTKTTTKWIRVIQRKDPNFAASTNKLCKADGPVQFTFSDTSGLFYKDNLLYTSKQFLADKVGKYIFKYEVRSEMCIDSNNQTIEVIERPNANFNPSKLIACVGDIPIQLNPEVNGGLFTGQYVKQNTFDPQKSGNYPILHKISNQLCNDSITKTINVYDKPVGSITYTPPMPFINDTVSFTFNGSKVSQYIWEFGNAASPETSKLANPKVEYLGFGIQNVSLSVIDSQGCSATFTRNVNVQNRSTLFVPNAFTPTSDGNNEYFLAVGDGIISYKMLIFNRWGELIFESNDINKGWDGKFQGVFCPSGVYTCFVNAVGSDNQTYQFNGTVTLIR